MVAEIAIMTGWTDEYILKMQAKRFFAMQKHLRLVDKRRQDWMLRELCYIAWIPNTDNNKYFNKLVDGYSMDIKNIKPKTRKDSLDLKDPKQFAAFASPFIQKKKLMGLQ